MTDREEILANWAVQLRAMDEADTAALRDCFTEDAVLVHMTGVQQPLNEWLAGMRRGDFVYHQVLEHGVDVSISGAEARVAGDITTGYRADLSGKAWPLHVEQDLVRTPEGWRCTESRVAFGHEKR